MKAAHEGEPLKGLVGEGDDLVGLGDVGDDALGESGIEFGWVYGDEELGDLLLGVFKPGAAGVGLRGFVLTSLLDLGTPSDPAS